jgi:hypothetical protein
MATPLLQAQEARAAGLPMLQWRDPALDLRLAMAEEQRALLQAATVAAAPLEEFKQQAARYLQTLNQPKTEAAVGGAVFMDVYRDDREAGDQIAKLAQQRGMLCLFPLESGHPDELRAHLQDNLNECDALLLLYGKSPLTWVRTRLLQAIKIIGRRPAKPYMALCELPPEPKAALNLLPPPYVDILRRDGLAVEDFLRRIVAEIERRLAVEAVS